MGGRLNFIISDYDATFLQLELSFKGIYEQNSKDHKRETRFFFPQR